MSEATQVIWYPEAEKLAFLIEPLLERSYRMFVRNNRKDVVSEYLSGSILVVTAQKPDGQCIQLAFSRNEIPLLPPECQRLLEADLKRPAIRGTFDFKV